MRANWLLLSPNTSKTSLDHKLTCRNRNGWNHTDVLRLSHPNPGSDEQRLVFKYITKGWEEATKYYAELSANPNNKKAEKEPQPQQQGKGGKNKNNNNNKSPLDQTFEFLRDVEFVSHETDYSDKLRKAISENRVSSR